MLWYIQCILSNFDVLYAFVKFNQKLVKHIYKNSQYNDIILERLPFSKQFNYFNLQNSLEGMNV
jgi:hypothetical protein